MSKTINQFDFKITAMTKTDRPYNPYVEIVLDNWSTDRDGRLSISSRLVNENELQEYIEALKADLDVVGRKAKAALRRAKGKTAEIVADRNSN